MNFNYVTIASIKENDYRIHFQYMSKDDAVNKIYNSNLNKTGVWWPRDAIVKFENKN